MISISETAKREVNRETHHLSSQGDAMTDSFPTSLLKGHEESPLVNLEEGQ